MTLKKPLEEYLKYLKYSSQPHSSEFGSRVSLRSESVLPVPKKKGGKREKTPSALGQKMDEQTLNQKELLQTVGAAYPLSHFLALVGHSLI